MDIYQIKDLISGACGMMNCTRNVFGTDVLKRTFEDKNFASDLKQIIDPRNNFLIVTSKSKYEIETQGLDFNFIITSVEKSLDGKIHYVEINSEVQDNLQFYRNVDSESKDIYILQKASVKKDFRVVKTCKNTTFPFIYAAASACNFRV